MKMLKKHQILISLILSLAALLLVWTVSGYDSLRIDTDLGRDLKEISNIQAGQVVWLGPWLGPGFHGSSLYYYMYYPAIELSGGKIAGMISFNVLIAFISVGFFGYLASKKYGYRGIVATLLIGLLPMVTSNVLHPGNGYTYIFFTIMALTGLWFKVPLAFSGLTAGMAIALHPAAAFLLPLLLIEWWLRGRSWRAAVVSLVAFLIPFTPLIAFELITNGYMIRSFLDRPSSEHFVLSLDVSNALIVGRLLGFSAVIFLVLYGLSGYYAWKSNSAKEKIWFFTSIVIVGVCLFLDSLSGRYAFTIALICIFSFLGIMMSRARTMILLFTLVGVLFIKSPVFQSYSPSGRSHSFVESIADSIAGEVLRSHDEKVGVVAAISPGAEVPHADDYRFLLRNRGYQVVDVTEQALADVLVMVIESTNFDWAGWSNWDIDSFGDKQLVSIDEFDGATVVLFEKSDGEGRETETVD